MTTSPYPFSDLSTAETQSAIRQRLVDNLAADGQPTTSWAPSSAGGLNSLRLDMVSGGIANLVSARVASLVNGRLLQVAADTPENGYWLSYLGLRFYGLQKYAASKTVQNFVLILDSSASSQTYRDGDLWIRSPSTGNRYRLTLPDGVTVQHRPGNAVNLPFYAENVGASYADASGTVTQLVTAKPGLSGSNQPKDDFRPTTQLGNSTGKLAIGLAETTGHYRSVRALIVTGGDVGTAQARFSVDDGQTYGAAITLVASQVIAGIGYVTATNGATPSFVAGSLFTMRRDDCFISRGTDAESDVLFRQRCRNRWPALSAVPTAGAVELWARQASEEVVRVTSDADPNIPGGFIVQVASATGPASPGAQETIETFINGKLSGFKGMPAPASPTYAGSTSPAEIGQVVSATPLEITAYAVVTVPPELLAGAIAGADAAWNAYLAGLSIDGTGLVEREAFFRVVGDLGAIDVQGLTLNGGGTDITVPAGDVAVPKAGYTLAANVLWVAGGTPALPVSTTPTAPGGPFSPNPQSISDLLPALSTDDVKAFLLAYIAVPADQVTDWESGGVWRTYWELESAVIGDLAAGNLAALAANGYPGDGGATGDSLTQIADAWYDVQRASPGAAVQSVSVTCDAAHGPYTADQVAAMVGTSSDGVAYLVTAGAAILGTGATIAVTMSASVPGAARGLVVSVAPLPGVFVSGASITSFGADGDNDAAVAAAVAARWPDLAAVPAQDRTISWALAAAPPPAITRFRLDADPAIPGGRPHDPGQRQRPGRRRHGDHGPGRPRQAVPGDGRQHDPELQRPLDLSERDRQDRGFAPHRRPGPDGRRLELVPRRGSDRDEGLSRGPQPDRGRRHRGGPGIELHRPGARRRRP